MNWAPFVARMCVPALAALCVVSALPRGVARAATGEVENAREARSSPSLSAVVAEFQRYSGARLVFQRRDLPGVPKIKWYDRMPALTGTKQLRAARIALREVQRLPPNYLGDVGLTHVGIFAACISNTGDGFRPYNQARKGYLYFGQYQRNAVVAAFYNDEQLPLTLHHEFFHHVDATKAGKPSHRPNFTSDDVAFASAIAGKKRYPALKLGQGTIAQLRRLSSGHILKGAVSDYAAKGPGEDQAETARYLASHLPDALLQAATLPGLAGSQRLLHVLNEYAGALPKNGGRVVQAMVRDALGENVYTTELSKKIRVGQPSAVRAARDRLVQFAPASDALRAAQAKASSWLVRQRLVGSETSKTANFRVFGREDATGTNWTLRRDLANHGHDLALVASAAKHAASPQLRAALTRELLSNVRLIADFQEWLGMRWSVTPGTRTAFNGAVTNALRPMQNTVAGVDIDPLKKSPLPALKQLIGRDGRLKTRPSSNSHLTKVDAAVKDATTRAAIRRVQPATVRVASGGSGVNVASKGMVLTNAHVLDFVGRKTRATFPDGREFNAICIYIDTKLDLAIAALSDSKGRPLTVSLPVARLSPSAAKTGDTVVIIGQPGTRTPSGEATGYQPFHVSVGKVRGYRPNRLDNQQLGRMKHDAWTYWGHSGSPLFDVRGDLIGLHNSWDSNTAMRHAVPWIAIKTALVRWKLLPK